MGKQYFDFCVDKIIYTCKKCQTHFGGQDNIMSKNFHGKTGQAYLFIECFNYEMGISEEKEMLTGLHKVCDVYCRGCHTEIGWKYEDAYEQTEKYKVGKIILEKFYLEEKK